MKLTLAENIRRFRKEKKLTQEKLAEALGVTVGAVYKWESGLSLPELPLIMELADFFDTSVDVLLGYQMKDNRLKAVSERIAAYLQTLDPRALSEAEKALVKYPNSPEVVIGSASCYLVFGAYQHEPKYLRRAMELDERAIPLLAQNPNPEYSEAQIRGNMASARFLLGEPEKCVELLKQNNIGGMYNGEIGTHTAMFLNRPEEAMPYLSDAMMDGVTRICTSVMGEAFVFRARKDWDSMLAVTRLGVHLLDELQTGQIPDFFCKMQAEMHAFLAYAESKAGLPEASRETMEKVREFALRFDLAPDYRLNTMRFVEPKDREAFFFDLFGATAADSIADLFRLLDDPGLSSQWKEVMNHES